MYFLLMLGVLVLPAALAVDLSAVCPGTIFLQRVPSTGHGTWWTVSATKASSGQCGLNNNQAPCKCTGFKFSSTLKPPYIPEYNSTVFGYNTKTSKYELQEAKLSLVDKAQPWAIFNFIDKASGSTTVVSALDTDDHKTFIIFYICGVKTADGKPIVIVVAKTQNGLNAKSQARVDATLKANGIDKSQLTTFNPKGCPAV